MKKSIISLVLVLSFCFQSTYPLFESAKRRKAQAMKLLKRLKPKGLITRFKEASKARDAAEEVYGICIEKNCNAEYEERERAARRFGLGSLRYRQADVKYELCSSNHCKNEKIAFDKAVTKFALMLGALGAAIEIGAIAVIAGVSGLEIYLDVREAQRRQEEQVKRKAAKKREVGAQTEPIGQEFPEPTEWKVSPVYEGRETVDIQGQEI